MEGRREWYRFMRGESMSDSKNVKNLKVNGECITDKNEIKECWEDIGGVGEILEVRKGCLILERKDANELNEKISRE